jgi:hypothetical protein
MDYSVVNAGLSVHRRRIGAFGLGAEQKFDIFLELRANDGLQGAFQ